MNSSVDTLKNQEDGSSSTRRKFMKMLGFAASAGIATAVAAAPVDIDLDQPPAFTECRSLENMKLAYDRQMLAHLCLMCELMREWYKANRDGIQLTCPEFAGALYDFMVESRSSARAVAKAAGIELDKSYIAKRAAEFREQAMGGAA